MENLLYLIVHNTFIASSVLRVNSIDAHNTALSEPNYNLRVFFVLFQQYALRETI